MAYILALIVGFGSVGLYMAAFFFPEVYRKNDFVLSGIGMFYALVLWVCAGRMTGGVLLGQVASVTLLGWLAWQSLEMRRSLTPIDQQTRLPGAARTLGEVLRKSAQELPGQLQQQVQRLSLPTALGGLSKRTSRAIATTPARFASRRQSRTPKQLQDGDRSLTPTAKQPRANSVKPAKPAKPARKPPVKPIAPPVSDSVTPPDLPIAPEALRDPRRQASAPDPLPDESPTPAAAPEVTLPEVTLPETPLPEATLPEALRTAAVSDDDFDFDDDMTPTHATAAELRQLTAQSAASRRPNWFTTLKLRLQQGRNSDRRSPQPISSDPMVPAPETAPEIAPETAPEIAPDANPEQSAPVTAENREATPVEAETLTPSSDADWDLDWAEDSTASEMAAAAAAAEFEGTGFPEPEGSVTITVAAEIIPAIETDPMSDSTAAEEWDLSWTQDVAAADIAAESLADIAAESLADIAADLLPGVEADSLPDFEPESAPEPAAESLTEPVPDLLSESIADSPTDLAAEPELDLDPNLDSDLDPRLDSDLDLNLDSDLDSEAAAAEWENWAEPAADQPAAVLPLLTEPEIDPLSEESNWQDADALACLREARIAPALLELPKQDREEIAVLEHDEAIGFAVSQRIAPPPDIDEPPTLVDESPTVIDESQSIVDESLSIIDESPRVVDESLNVGDESSSVLDESSNLVDESLSLIDESLSVVDESLSVVDESLNVIDESLSPVDESLKGEFELTEATEATDDTSTQPARRRLTIQIVKLEPSETTPEPPPEPEVPPSYE